MKKLAITLLFSFVLFATPVMTSSGHDHGHSHEPISKKEIMSKATKEVHQLAKAGKIDSSYIS